ncbi:hypothetical protein EDD85DRAFT_953150 [Armillaria nabsnona]|nr:hypothetical protein EDD85DRAFT_953150 [Armillaria nabsnona]
MYGWMNDYHDLQREMDESSEEERKVGEMWGKADEATPKDDEGDSAISGGPPSVMEGEEEEVDLDASIENPDESEKEQE